MDKKHSTSEITLTLSFHRMRINYHQQKFHHFLKIIKFVNKITKTVLLCVTETPR